MRKVYLFGAIWIKLALYLMQNSTIYFFLNYAGTEPSKGAFWNQFSEQHQNQSIKKLLIAY